MKKLLLLTTAFFAVTAAKAADTYKFDPSHTYVGWQASHFGFSNVSGKFAKVEGTLSLDEKAPEKSTVEAKISIPLISTGDDKFDAHIKSAEILNAEKFSTAEFKSTKVEKSGEKTAKVTGDLTLLGVTKPIVLDVKFNSKGEHPFSKKQTVGFSAETVLKRSEFGISYAVPGVSDDVKIHIESEASLEK